METKIDLEEKVNKMSLTIRNQRAEIQKLKETIADLKDDKDLFKREEEWKKEIIKKSS
jgi:predicted ATPase with chaperone activity